MWLPVSIWGMSVGSKWVENTSFKKFINYLKEYVIWYLGTMGGGMDWSGDSQVSGRGHLVVGDKLLVRGDSLKFPSV